MEEQMKKQTITKSMVVADLKKVSKKVSGNLTRAAYRSHGSFASSTVESKMGSWAKAKRVR